MVFTNEKCPFKVEYQELLMVHWVVHTTNKMIDTKETVCSEWVLIVTELFNIVVTDYGAKKYAHYSQVLFLTKLVVSGTQCQ